MLEKLVKTMIKVMRAEPGEIVPDSSMETVGNWDSISHMSLVMAIEEEFDVALTDEEIVEMKSVEAIHQILKEKT